MNFALILIDKSVTDLLLPALIAVIAFLIVFLLARKRSETTQTRFNQPAPAEKRQPQKNSAPATPRRDSGGNTAADSSSAYDPSPRFLLLGPSDSGKTSLLNELQGEFSVKDRTWVADLASGVARWQFAGGEVLEIAGNLFAPAGDSSETEKDWKSFLGHLQKQRPRRPLDGIILTVPSTHLDGEHALTSDDLQREASHASSQLKLLRDRLGFCLPVYLVVTKCDTIPGYRTFAKTLLASHLSEIFGWSNPYNLDAPFDPQWTAQAFTEVYRGLSNQRMEFFARSAASGQPGDDNLRDELFLFPVNLQKLQSPLAAYLEQLLHGSGYRDALQFRGIYFSGSAMPATEAFEEIHHDTGHDHGTGFTADLFNQKIFPERSLARPVETAFAHRSTEVTVTRALCAGAALLLFPGAILGWYNLRQTAREAAPFLRQIQTGLSQGKETPNAGSAYATIYAAQGLSGSNFQSAFLPASLLGSLDQQVREVMAPVFNQLVYPGLRAELEQRIGGLLEVPAHPAVKGETGPAPATATTAAQRLANFTDTLLALESNVVRFNRLAPAGRVDGKDMLALASSLSPATFARLSSRNTSGLDEIVRDSSGTPIDGQPWNQPAAERLEALVTDVLRQSVNEEQLLTSLDTLISRINLLEENKLETYEQLQGLSQSLGQVQKQLAAPDLQWIAGSEDQFQLPAELSVSLNRIFSQPAQQNVLLCDAAHEQSSCANLQQLKASIEQMARAHFADLRKLLLSAQTATTGPLVATTGAKLQLSQPAINLQTVLNTFLQLPFVAHDGSARLRDLEGGQQLFWDNDRLQAAIQDKQAYDKFFASQLANTSNNLQDTFEEVALSRLEANMVDSAASAQQFEPLPSGDKIDQATTNEVRAFQAASDSLGQVMQQFSELNFDNDYQDLLRVSTTHALMMLTRIDRSFEARHFYWPPSGNFDHWTSGTLPSATYGTHNAEEMAAYLVTQRQDVQQYAASAQPLVTFLQKYSPKSSKQTPLVARWQSIVGDLQKYESAAAASGLGSVEDLLANGMDKIAAPDCQVPSSPVTSSLIYFVQARRSLERALVSRCHGLSNQSAFQQYSQLAGFFNQKLAGKFPFAAPPADDSAPQADPADVLELFHRLDADNGAILQGLQSSLGASSAAAAKLAAFVNQLTALRPLFASLLSGQPGAAPAFDTAPAFRVNRNHEINGNQIIDWNLQIGGNTFRNFDPPSTHLGWNYGDPVKLMLRWAKDSPQQPVPVSPATANAATRTVVFEYHDPWSLLRMLAEHTPAAADLDRSVDADPQTLVFTATQTAAAAGKDTPAQAVKVFIRIRIYAPGKTDALKVPPFPVRAPTP